MRRPNRPCCWSATWTSMQNLPRTIHDKPMSRLHLVRSPFSIIGRCRPRGRGNRSDLPAAQAGRRSGIAARHRRDETGFFGPVAATEHCPRSHARLLPSGPNRGRLLGRLHSRGATPVEHMESKFDELSLGLHPGVFSGIALASTDQPGTPDHGSASGVMTALELAALDLRKVDVLVLSACETGLGELVGEGMLGLQRACQIAGVRTTVTSLWKVEDEATRQLMVRFYRNLWEGQTAPLEALREARSCGCCEAAMQAPPRPRRLAALAPGPRLCCRAIGDRVFATKHPREQNWAENGGQSNEMTAMSPARRSPAQHYLDGVREITVESLSRPGQWDTHGLSVGVSPSSLHRRTSPAHHPVAQRRRSRRWATGWWG